MAQRWKCRRGHTWQADTPADATLAEVATPCPSCGDTQVFLDDSQPPVSSADATLPPESAAVGSPTPATQDDTCQLEGGPPNPLASSLATLDLEGKPAASPSDATCLLSETSLARLAQNQDRTAELSAVLQPDATVALGEASPSLPHSDATAALPGDGPPAPDATLELTEQATPAASDQTLDVGDAPGGEQTAGLHDCTLGVEEVAGGITSGGITDRNPDATVAVGRAAPTRGGGVPDATMDIPVPPATREGPGRDATANLFEMGRKIEPARRPAVAPKEPARPKRKGQLPIPVIEGYEILGELGRGAMGVVYKAKQVGLNRLVALKMILAGAHARPQELMRFRIEAEAIAQFQHPYIVQVYEIAEQDGCPYFSLEFLDGGCLADKLKGQPIPPAEAARWVLQLAEAMDYAHRRGIIHRDLKPANVLLTRDGMPKITDFGLAKKFEGDSSATRDGAIMGTPSYMAPEQAAGKTKELGPPADIYALGAILYDLLTGRPPFRGETVMETLQQVMHMEPTAPRKLQPKLPNDLNVICLKCLEKDPQKRYASAGALADDLRAFLNGEPISARPVSRWERTVKWAKRRPAAASLAGLSVLSLIGFITFILVLKGISDANAESEKQSRLREEGLRVLAQSNEQLAKTNEQLAKEAAKREEGERIRAEDNFEYALEAVNKLLTRVGQQRLAHEPRMEGLRRGLLEDALRFFDRFLKNRPDNPRLRWETALSHLRCGDIYDMLGQYEDADRAYKASADILAALCAEFPDLQTDAKYHGNLAICRLNWGVLLEKTGRSPQAEQQFRASAELAENLVRANPGYADYPLLLAKAHLNWGAVLEKIGRPQEGADKLRQSAAELDVLLKAAPSNLAVRLDLVLALNNGGLVLRRLGKATEAVQAFERAEELLLAPVVRETVALEGRERLALVRKNLGVALRDVDLPRAVATLAEASHAYQKLSADFPTVPMYVQELANALGERAVALQAAGMLKDAQETAAEAEKLKRKLADQYHSIPDYRADLAAAIQNTAVALHTQGQLVEAEKQYTAARNAYQSLVTDFGNVPQYQLDLVKTLTNMAVFCVGTNRVPLAQELVTEAERSLKQLLAAYPDRPDYVFEMARAYASGGGMLQLTGRFPAAAALYDKALELLDPLAQRYDNVPDYAYQLAKTLDNRGTVRAALKKLPEAEADWKRAIELLDRLIKDYPASPLYPQQWASVHNAWGSAIGHDRTRDVETERHFADAVAAMDRLVGRVPDDPQYRQELSRYTRNQAIMLGRQNRLADAEKSLRRGLETLLGLMPAAASAGPYAADLIDQYASLAELHRANGARDESRQCWAEVLALQDRRIRAHPADPAMVVEKVQTLATLIQQEAGDRWPAEAAKHCRTLIETLREAVRSFPQHGDFQEQHRVVHLQLMELEIQQDRHAAAAQAADALRKLIPENWPLRQHLAIFLGRCAQLASADQKLPEDQRRGLTTKYADWAMRELEMAVLKGGFRDRDVLEKEPALAPLRHREEFKKLLQALAAKGE